MEKVKQRDHLLILEGIQKVFPGVIALDGVNLQIGRGEVHGLIGENGAGKSTLIKILCGIYRPDGGAMILDGEAVSFSSPTDSQNKGIQVMHQEIRLHGNLTVAENIFINHLPVKAGFLNKKTLYRRAEALLETLDITSFSVRDVVGGLSLANQQMVTLARILSNTPKIVLMDEPTASLTQNEALRLFGIINELKQKGVTVIYISHYLEEVRKITDRISILRDGKYVGTYDSGEVDTQELVQLVAGKAVEKRTAKEQKKLGNTLLAVDRLAALPVVHDVSFSVREGEVVGIYALNGAGKSETLRTIYGIDRQSSGTISVRGMQVNLKTVQDALKQGIILLPEDRRRQGLVLKLSVKENIALGNERLFSRCGFISRQKERPIVESYVKKMRIKAPSLQTLTLNLSGGNQQKVVLARSMCRNMKIFMLDEPTVGIDVGARSEIYQLIEEMAENGAGVVVASSDFNEIMEICDKAVILYQGRVAATLGREAFSEDAMLFYAMGGNKDET